MLSVLVPVYNVEKYIHRCVESILNQSYDDLEVILVDDGSTDESGALCDGYARKDSRVKVIHKNTARIAGLQAATKRYVTFVDSDDYIESTMYEKLMQKILHSHADIVVGGYVSEYEDGTVLCSFTAVDEKFYASEDALCAMFEGDIFNWSLCDKIYRRSLFDSLDDISKWPSSYGEDTYMNYKLFSLAEYVFYMPLYAYHYCLRNNSLMRSGVNEGYFAYLDIYASIVARYSKDNMPKFIPSIMRLLISFYYKCLSFTLKKRARNKKQIAHYHQVLLQTVGNVGYHATDSIQHTKLLRTYSDWEKLYAERAQVLRDFAKIKEVYIYGIGAIAEEVADTMEENGIHFKGFCVTRKEICLYKHKPVYAINEIVSLPNDTGFILAMRENSEQKVSHHLEQLGYRKFLCAGKYSVFYSA